MQAFLQSAFMQSLAYALLSSIWQTGLLWVVVFALIKLFKFSSSQKFNIAFTAQASGFALFIYTLLHASQNGLKIINITAPAGNYANNINTFISWLMPYIAVMYLAMLIYQVFKLFFVYRLTQNLRRHDLKKISAGSRIFVQEMSELFSLHKKVHIYLSGKIKCPLTIGFLKPVILIPLAAINHLTNEQMEAVILHELAHIKRADYLLFLLQSLIEKLFFFNIFSNMLGDIIERERENACDDWVLQFKYNSIHYAEALLKLGRLQTATALAMPAAGKKQSLLLARIKRLLHPSGKNIAYGFHSLLFSFLTLIIALGMIASTSVKISENKPTAVTNQQSVFSNAKGNPEVAIMGLLPAAKKSIENSKTKTAETVAPKIIDEKVSKAVENMLQSSLEVAKTEQIDPEYLINVNQAIDSLTQVLPEYNAALDKQFVLTPEDYKQVLSYQNFKQLETMLAVTGDSLNITESNISKDSYRKQITIETTDKKGNKHVYNLVVELYQ